MTAEPPPGPARFRPSRTLLTMYVPFAVLVLLQGSLVVFAPSSHERPQNAAFGGTPSFDGPGAPAAGGTEPVAPGGAGPVPGAVPGVTPAAPAGPGGPSAAAPGSPSPGGPGGPALPTTAPRPGDTSHCTADGRQHGVVYYAPPCVPAWDGPHTGATSRHVGDDGTILGILMLPEVNPALQAMAGGNDPENTPENANDYAQLVAEFINTRFELYGRRLELEVVESDCPLTPQDPPACKQAAQEIAARGPFFADFTSDFYPDLFDIWVREGIVATGGAAIDDPYYTGRRPFRWTESTTGGDIVRMAGNFVCTQMAGRPATHSGQVIHPSIGVRGEVERKYGILINAGREPLADGLEAALVACGVPPGQIIKVRPEGDITRAAEEVRVVVAKFIEEKVTTVVWASNPLAPVIGTPEMTRNNYFPENLVLGSTGVDNDDAGQLYDREQWQHAFGPSTAGPGVPEGEDDASKVWREMGGEGNACGGMCQNVWSVANLWGHMLQAAGPELTPENIERGMFAMGPRGGWEATADPGLPLFEFGPGDYGGLSDHRIVWWNPNKISPANGGPGSYETVEGGRRWRFGAPLPPELGFDPAPR